MLKSMLKYVKVTPIAAESLGVRSMCTYVETPDARILLDAGVSVCPNRFGLPPHPQEFKAIIDCRKRIAEAADKAEIITLSHYHFDHHTPSYEDWLCNWTAEIETARQIYAGKTVLMKNPKEQINPSQRRRAWMFRQSGGKYAEKLEIADGKTFIFGDTLVRFSEPVFHGSENAWLGWVLMATIERQGEKFLFAPDIQGPISTRTLELIVGEKPQVIMLGGPPLYLVGFKVSETEMQTALRNLRTVVEHVPTTILEHHILRDGNWQERSTDVFYAAFETDHTVQTAAEFLGRQNRFLEAKRRKLYAEEPPLKEFEKWMKLGVEARERAKPPV
jgi:predicted metallo-beta-lactamase superfamily hydrolase